jgi:hypothetical protein
MFKISSSSYHISDWLGALSETSPRELMKEDASEYMDSDQVENENVRDKIPEEVHESGVPIEEKQDEENKTPETTETKPAEDKPASSETEQETSTSSDNVEQIINNLKNEFEKVKTDYQQQKEDKSLEEQITKLKKQIENIDSQDDANLNDSIIQSSIKNATRNLRRIKIAIVDSKMRQLIEREYQTNPHLNNEDLAHLISQRNKDISVKDAKRFLDNYDKTKVWTKLN